MKIFIFWMIICLPALSFLPQENKLETAMHNEAILIIRGPGFKGDAVYKFLPDILTVGGAQKQDKITKISLTRGFGANSEETITLAISTTLSQPGSTPIGWTTGDIGIVYSKATDNDTKEINIGLGIKDEDHNGTLTIAKFDGFISGSFNVDLQSIDGNKYNVKCTFKSDYMK